MTCPGGDPLVGIYSPSRLKVIDTCRWFRGTVLEADHRNDGDLHVLMKPDTQDAAMLNVGNVNAGGMVVEIVPGQPLPPPAVGDHIAVFGTYVLDQHNEWNEIHPVFAWKNLTSGELFQGMPPPSPESDGPLLELHLVLRVE
ncbi:MAG: hypothetical protein ABJC60_05350 [Actinomycetota bacterium]